MKRAWFWGLACCNCVGLAVQVTPSLASGWEKLDSVHFNAGHLDFGIVPRRAVIWYEHTDRPVTKEGEWSENGDNWLAQYELTSEHDDKVRQNRDRLKTKLYSAARDIEGHQRWDLAVTAYYRVAAQAGWEGGVRDRIAALSAFNRLPATERRSLLPQLQRYLWAMHMLDAGKLADAREGFQRITADGASGFLREHALYQLASAEYQRGKPQEAVAGYQKLLTSYPRGRKTEEALIMLARASILPAQRAADAVPGSDALARLKREFPRSRFRAKALGLAARVHMLAGRFHEAAWCYLQLGDLESAELVRKQMAEVEAGPIRVRLVLGHLKRLDHARSFYRYEQSIAKLDKLSKILTSTDAFRINVALLRDPEAASAYLYYRLYHWENSAKDLVTLQHLGDKIAGHIPMAQLAPAVRLRLAELYYQNHQYRKALAWVGRATEKGDWDRSYFVRGGSLHKLGRVQEAMHQFQMLLDRFPNSSLRHGAREEMALLYEQTGDLQRALKQYFLLGYQGDVAFMLDARMNIPQVEEYYHRLAGTYSPPWQLEVRWSRSGSATERTCTERDLVAYSIGYRYVRREEWREAARWFRMVQRKAYVSLSDHNRWEDEDAKDPLTLVRILSKLHRATKIARSDNARASNMYAYASYYYKHGDLLLYNQPLWQGERRSDFCDFWNTSHATKQDEETSREHMYEHEAYNHTRLICKQIARLYPNSPTAPYALYRGACATYRLSDFNDWWREGHKQPGISKQGDALQNESARMMKRVALKYPRSELAKAAAKYAQVFAATGQHAY